MGRKYSVLKGGFFALISLIIRNKRPSLGTWCCQGETAEINSSLRESLVRRCFREALRGWSCMCVRLLLVTPDLQLHRVVLPEWKVL